jgi:hypothetical protein
MRHAFLVVGSAPVFDDLRLGQLRSLLKILKWRECELVLDMRIERGEDRFARSDAMA